MERSADAIRFSIIKDVRRLSKVKIQWSPDFAYAIGLIATDGNLSKDSRHLNMTSKDKDLIGIFKKCLLLNNKIGCKAREKSKIRKYFQIQFGDKNFYEFLLSLGLTPAKSKTIGLLNIPPKHFADFLRGCIDGDGNIDIHNHPESQHLQLRVRLFSASLKFLEWIKDELAKQLELRGGWLENYSAVHVLSFGKSDSVKLLNFIYYNKRISCLRRKYLIAKPFLRV